MEYEYIINAKGHAEIEAFLNARHKKAGQFTHEMIQAWASEAEAHANNGSGAFIELKAWEAASGHAEEFEISDAGVDRREINVD